MKRILRISVWVVLLFSCAAAFGQSTRGTMAFTISLPQPSTHTFHVAFRCDGLKAEMLDFKMPAWMPGFYRIMDYARNVTNFTAEDGAGHALPWEKVTRNTWRVATGSAHTILVSYDVFGNTSFAAQNFLNEQRAFIAPPGLYMYVAGQIQHPATVSITLPTNWSQIATGLDPVRGQANTFSASDFDVLYDCPMLMGNQEVLQFEVRGTPHKVVLENVAANVERPKMLADLKRMVEAATNLIGDVPYKHYTFLLIGTGNGGIEHANSAAIFFNENNLGDASGYLRWLSYVAHEYFHSFNVKRIRPIALGPFDYDAENLTNMLWVSEGLSVYYQDLLLVRAGLMTAEQYLDKMKASIARFENAPGHRYQSATESSLYTWGTSGVGGDRNTTISYYDNGAMLGAMLDLKIRQESKNQRSLDDVMRALYRKYYQEKKRGFTDAEFREECERAAGGPVTEVFEYASTTKDVDYAKYFTYAGLELTATSKEAPGAYLGVNTQTFDGKLVISSVTTGSPAQNAGLVALDQILDLDGTRATTKVLSDLLAAKKPGDTLKVRYSRSNATQDAEIVLGKNTKSSFDIKPMPNPDPLQSAILKDWLRMAQ